MNNNGRKQCLCAEPIAVVGQPGVCAKCYGYREGLGKPAFSTTQNAGFMGGLPKSSPFRSSVPERIHMGVTMDFELPFILEAGKEYEFIFGYDDSGSAPGFLNPTKQPDWIGVRYAKSGADFFKFRAVPKRVVPPANFRELERLLQGFPDSVNIKERPSFDSVFMAIAELLRTRATCPRRKVGAVIVADKRILSTGYNGAPGGLADCGEAGCLIDNGSCKRAVHAEQNALIQAARNGVSTIGASMYTTSFPCIACANMIIQAGIRYVIYRESYDTQNPEITQAVSAMFDEAGVSTLEYA